MGPNLIRRRHHAVLLTPQKNAGAPAPLRRHSYARLAVEGIALAGRRSRWRAIALSSSSVLASYQAATSASICGSFGHPKNALSPFARMILLVGSTQSTPYQSV